MKIYENKIAESCSIILFKKCINSGFILPYLTILFPLRNVLIHIYLCQMDKGMNENICGFIKILFNSNTKSIANLYLLLTVEYG